jgi:hypothetical protein
MDRTDNRVWTCRDAGRPKPPNGKTLALLCLKFVKHHERLKIRQKSAKPLENRKKNAAQPGFQAVFSWRREPIRSF